MKIYLALGCLLIGAFNARAQTTNNNSSYFIEAYDVQGRPFTSEGRREIRGTPLFVDSWAPGNVIFAKGRAVRQIDLKFDLARNELYFRKDDMVLTFLEPVREFSFAYDSSGEKKYAYFRCGYPYESSKTGATFYEVLVDGQDVQLIKYAGKTILEEFRYGVAPTKAYKLIEEYYVYDVKSVKLERIKKDKSSFAKALPQYADAIGKFTSEKKTKLRSEKDIIEMVKFLNGQ